VGGGPVEMTEHVLEPWEKRVDALCGILAGKARGVMTIDERRDAIETLGEDKYRSLKYYELWMAGTMNLLVEKEILAPDEIDARMDQIRKRLGLEAEK
jgi:hypothetical protein